MKSIKSKFIRGLSLLLALVVLLNIPISALASAVSEAAYVPTDDAIIQEMLDKGYDEDRAEMIAHDAFQALKYLGYDYDKYLEDNGLLFTKGYYGSKLLTNHKSSLTSIAWTNNGNGMQTTSTKSPYSNADSYTGEYPDVTMFKETGLDCADYVSYYYTNYLPNIAGVDVSVITDAMAYVMAKNNGMYGNDYSYMNFWDDARDYFKSHKVDVFQVTKSGSIDSEGNVNLDGNILEYIDPYGNKKTDDIFAELPIGTLIQMGEMPGDDYNQDGQTTRLIHYAVYAGSWTDPSTGKTQHYIAHSSNKKRGPEISTLYNMSPEANGTNKSSVAMYFYVFKSSEEQYGSITIKKEGPKGESLAGAEFLIVNKETNEAYKIIADSDGIASLGELPLGTYTVTEVEAPPGYVKSDKTWTITLTKDDPTGGGTLTVVNEPDVGSLQILKEITPTSAAIPENLAGWQFKLYHNSPVKTATLNSSSANRSYRVTVTDKYGNSVSSAAGHMAIGPVITKQPTDQFTANGSNFTFSVTATNAASYQWEYSANSGKTWSNWTSSASTSSTFTRAMSDTMRKYQFRCKITDSSGHVVYSDAVTPYHNTEFAITTQPQSQVSTVGSSASFTVGLSGSTSGATYQWQTSSNGGSSWSNVSTSATYTANKTSTSLLKVRCTVTVNGVSKTSDVADWVRADYKDASGDPAIYIAEAPKDYVGKSGSTASFEVLAAGEGLVYQWEYKLDDAETWVPVEKAYSDDVYETDTSGKTKLIQNIPVGSYYIKELTVSGKENWDYDFPKAIEITTGTTVYVTFTNEQHTGGLKIQKSTEDGKNLANWEFAIYQDKACTKLLEGGLFTGSAGTIIVDGLEPGMTVWVKEVGHKDSAIGNLYKVQGDNPKSAVVSSDEIVTIDTFENVLKYGSLEIQKTTNTGKNLTGWRVNVYKGAVATANRIPGSPFTITDANGILVIDNLEPGTYYVKEVNDGDEYWVCDTTARKVTVVAGETADPVVITNKQYGKLDIKKVMTDGSSPAGWQFNVYDPDGSLIDGSPFKTDSDGKAIGLNEKLLDPGEYTIEEILVSDSSYTVVGSQKKTVTVERDVTADPVIFENTPKLGSLQIQKKTSTGTDLAGWQFQVFKNITVKAPYNTSNTTNRSYRVKITDANGNVTYSDAVTMKAGAEITKQPVSQAVAAGSSATFSVTAKGTDLKYQWQWKSPSQSTWTNSTASGATTASLNINMTAATDGRQYRCQITDGSGNVVYSDVASVYLPSTLAILAQPENIVCEQGTKSVFSVSASGSNLTYQWQTKNEGSSSWTNQSGQTKATYTAKKGSTPLVYVRCAVSDGTNTIYTEPVIWALPEYDGKEIIIVEQPQPYFTPIGNQARFEVVAAGKDLIYQWEYQVSGSSTWLSAEEKFTTKTYSTDSDGLTDVISGLPCGSYYIKEVDTGLEDWIYDTEPKYVEITPENYETAQKVTVTNVKIITGITLNKTTSDGKNLEGWLFSIYSDEACTKPIVENLRTNANGLITKEDLPLGTVWVKEIGHELEEIEKQYYINSTNPQSTVIENGVPAYVEFENMLKSGSLQILKQTNTGKELAGWQFQLYKNVTARSPWNTANTTNRSYRVKITDANGNVTYSYAAHMGTGAEITKQPVSQAVAAGSSATFSVTAKGTGLTYQWQWKYPTQSTWTNSTASGATTASLKFTMASPFDGRQFRCQITDGSGNVVYSDAASIYLPTTLAILAQPESIVCEQGTKSVFSVSASGSNVTYQWQTKNLGAASWSNQSGKTTATYSATKGSTPVVYVRCAVSDGTTTIYTEPVIWALSDYEGDTIIVEQPQDYYCALNKQAHYEIVAIGNKLVYQWEYQTDGSSTWVNVDELYSKTKYETDEDGKTDIISDMPTGSYYVKEIKSSSSQWICDLIPKRIDIDVDTLESIQYANFYNIKTTNITIQKVTEDNENLKGWIFEIYYDQACTNLCVGSLETDEDGYITVKNLKPGKYWIKEVGHTDAGIEDLYVAKTPIQEVNVVVDTTNSFLFENMLKYGSLVIQKETNTGKNLEGWTVNVYIGSVATENRVPGSPFKTDSDGRIIVNNLLPGKYIVKEYTGNINAYWTGDDIPHEVVVEAGKTTDPVYINNVHHAKLNIKKVMADGKSPVGWQFNLYDPTGALVPGSPFKVDNADGTVSELKNKLLLPGEYTVEEIISDDDTYMVNQKRQTVTLEAGKTASVTFINTPKTGSVQIIKETNTGNDLAGWQFLIYQNSPFRNPYNSEKTTNRAYRVKITDANGNVVYSDAANMTAGIHISKQPEHQIAAAGSSAIFSVKASGTGLTYQWETLRPGASSWMILTAASAINSGSQTDTYTLASMSESMDGRIYRCKITDSNGNSVYSEEVYLHLPSTFAILEYPKDSVCAQGSKTKFSVLVSGDNVTYQWQTRNENATTWVNQPNQTKSTYTTSVKGSMPLVYVRCLIYNNGVLVEESQNHTAKWVLPEYNGKDILILEQPKDYTGPLNKNAQFDVVAVGKDLIYEWEYKVSGSTSWLPSETLYTGDVELITDQYGKTPTLSGIPCGEYYIKEVNDGKENWIYDTSVRFLKVTPDNYTTMQTPGSFFNTHYGIGKIVKNTNTGENREGWIFEITDEDSNPVKDAFGNPIGLQTTDKKGMISLNLLPGTYLVREVGPENDKWQLDKSTKTLVVEAGEIKTVSFLNIMYGSLDIVKKTTNGGTLVGWTFLIEDENNEVIGQYTTTAEDIITDANGENVAKISISILPGTYYITEIANDDAYWTVDKSIVVVDVESDATATATFVNKWTGKASILKVMTDGSSPAGWQFQVIGPDGKEIPGSPFTTDENGDIHINNLQPGDYIIEELIPMDCLYRPVGENPKTIKVRAGETASVTFENDLRPGKLMIEKVNETGDHLAGAKFLLEWSTDGINWSPVMYSSTIIPGSCSSSYLIDGCLITGESGIIEFTNLHPALQYRVTEVEAPNGYVLQTESVFIGPLPTEDLTVSLLVKNDHVFIMPSTGVPAGFNTALKASFTAVFAAFMIAGAVIVSPRMVSVPKPDEKHKK